MEVRTRCVRCSYGLISMGHMYVKVIQGTNSYMKKYEPFLIFCLIAHEDEPPTYSLPLLYQ